MLISWTMMLVATICAVVVFLCCLVLVFDPDYEDGPFGRIALALLAIGAAARVMDFASSGIEARFTGISLVVWVGLAIFFSRHVLRFWHWRSSGSYDWRKPEKGQTGGKLSNRPAHE